MYKTIVMHVDGMPDFSDRLAFVAELAKDHGAHLVGAATIGGLQLDFILASIAGIALAPPFDQEQLRSEANKLLEEFETRSRRLGLESVETRLFSCSTEDALMLQSRYCDLLVVGQGDATDGNPVFPTRLAGYLAVHAACPVLLLPSRASGRKLSGTVVVGWNASLEASHAVMAALPILQGAEKVVLGVFNPDDSPGLHGKEPGADLALHLARHGVRVDIVSMQTKLEPGRALLTLAENAGAALVVAGAYGHSRFNEWVVGGTSATLLGQTMLPVLMKK